MRLYRSEMDSNVKLGTSAPDSCYSGYTIRSMVNVARIIELFEKKIEKKKIELQFFFWWKLVNIPRQIGDSELPVNLSIYEQQLHILAKQEKTGKSFSSIFFRLVQVTLCSVSIEIADTDNIVNNQLCSAQLQKENTFSAQAGARRCRRLSITSFHTFNFKVFHWIHNRKLSRDWSVREQFYALIASSASKVDDCLERLPDINGVVRNNNAIAFRY